MKLTIKCLTKDLNNGNCLLKSACGPSDDDLCQPSYFCDPYDMCDPNCNCPPN